MTEHTPTPEQHPAGHVPADDFHLDSPPGSFAADAAERAQAGQGPDPQDAAVRPLTEDDITPTPTDDDAGDRPDPALVGPTALDNLLATDTTITIGEGPDRQTVPLRFDLLALATLEKQYGNVMAPMQRLSEAAVALEGGAASEGVQPELIGTVLEVTKIAASRQKFTVPDELRAGNAGAPVMPARVRVKDQPDVFVELLADGPESFVDLLLKVVAAFAAAFGSADGRAEGNDPSGSTGSPGGSGGTSPSANSTSALASSGA